MKILYFLLIIICFNSNNIAQCTLTNDLDSPDWGDRFSALKTMAKENMVECIPEIHQRIFNQPSMVLRYFFLNALSELNDPEIEYWALVFIDSADNFEDPLESLNSLRYKVDATKILFDAENYSTAHLVFDLLSAHPDDVGITALVLLNEIIIHVPSYAESAKSELVRILNNYEIISMIRIRALNFLDERNYSNIIDECLNAVLNDPVSSIRHAANAILRRRNYDVHSLYLQQLNLETDPVIRSKYATVLLNFFGEPSDLKAVIDFHPTETDTTMLWFVGYEIDNFIPPRPTVSTSQMITNLIGYVGDLYQYGWLRDLPLTTINWVDSLQDLQKYYSRGNSEASCNKINGILNTIETYPHPGYYMSDEGYKFLHYHSVYIKENIEDEFGPCE